MFTNGNKDNSQPHSFAKGDLFEDVPLFEWHDETKSWDITPEAK